MKRKLPLLGLILLLGALLALGYSARDDLQPRVARLLAGESRHFVAQTLPANEFLQLYDLGVVDANGDGWLDLYTSNHNYRQNLWLADGQGGYRDALTEWGLDQSSRFPGGEQSRQPPVLDAPGLYIYWLDDILHLVAHRVDGLPPLRGAITLYNKAEVMRNQGFTVSSTRSQATPAAVPVTRLEFSSTGPGELAMFIPTRGTPIRFQIDPPWTPAQVFVGNQRIPPAAAHFELTLRDRHGLAWSDYNDDGQLDVFITRGALGGTLRKFPPEIRAQVRDELLVSRAPGRFTEQSIEHGIHKQDCSGRHVKWVDINRDNLLDLYINCQDRGNVAGGYSKQLYLQDRAHRFAEASASLGLDIPGNQLVDFAWLDANGDGDIDLLTHEDKGFFLYTRQAGRYVGTFIARGAFERADKQGLKGNTDDYWQFDGKLSLADYDSDGDLDAFAASKKGNVLLIGENGSFRPVPPRSVGLPEASVAAAWVDYDNDGKPDLHTIPEGIFHQGDGQRFTSTRLLALPKNRYQAAFIHWFDRDNDGKQDVLIATQDNAALWRWWERPFKSRDVKGRDDRFRWALQSYRNQSADAHWLQLNLVGPAGNRQAIGTSVTVATPAGRQIQVVGSSEGSYFSQGHYRLYFGLGAADKVDSVTLRWPDGRTQVLHDIPADNLLTIHQETRPEAVLTGPAHPASTGTSQ